jgi:hypothetical protein
MIAADYAHTDIALALIKANVNEKCNVNNDYDMM